MNKAYKIRFQKLFFIYFIVICERNYCWYFLVVIFLSAICNSTSIITLGEVLKVPIVFLRTVVKWELFFAPINKIKVNTLLQLIL